MSGELEAAEDQDLRTLWPRRRCSEYLLLSPGFPAVHEMLLSLISDLRVPSDAGRSCSEWKPDLDIKQSIMAVALLGVGPNAPRRWICWMDKS